MERKAQIFLCYFLLLGGDITEKWLETTLPLRCQKRTEYTISRRWIGQASREDFEYLPWPPRSPDLTPCDFFIWGFVKQQVYRPRTAADLKWNIRNEIAAIPGVMLQRVMWNFRERLQECVNNNGQHPMDMLFKKWLCYIRCFEINCIFVINSFSIMKYFLCNYNLKMIRYFCRTL